MQKNQKIRKSNVSVGLLPNGKCFDLKQSVSKTLK